MIWEVLTGGSPLRELKPDNRSVFDRIDIEDQTKPEYPVITVDPAPNAATVIELFREYKVRIAEDNFSVLTGRIRPGTLAARSRQKRGMTYKSFTGWFYKVKALGLVHAIDELPLDRAGRPPGRLGNTGGLLTIREDPVSKRYIVVRARRVLYELTDLGSNESSWVDVNGSYEDLAQQLSSERKQEDNMPLENEYTSTIGGKPETDKNVPIRTEERVRRTPIQRLKRPQTTSPAIGGAPVTDTEPPEETEDAEDAVNVSGPDTDAPVIPDFDLPERVEKRSVGLLISHLGRLVEIGMGFTEVQIEIDDLTEQLEDWLNQLAEEKGSEEGKASPNAGFVKELNERFNAVSEALVSLRDYDPRGAIEELKEGFGLV
ncbi:MAG: hypothetical protein Q8P23_00940 [bacterium]|nr:hypothetical protein [bacterium]